MAKHVPDVTWSKRGFTCDDAKAHLAHWLEVEYSKLTLEHRGREKKINFECYPKLSKDVQARYDEHFRGGKRVQPDDEKKKSTNKSAKIYRPFGHGLEVD